MNSPVKFGSEFIVNTTTTNGQYFPEITALADGRFVVSWEDYSLTGGDTSSSAIRAQIFNANGSKSGSEFLVNTTTTSSQIDPTITGMADGGFIVSWQDDSATGGDTTGSAIRAQMFNADGIKSGGEFLVNSTTTGAQIDPSITVLANGGFVVSWQDNNEGADDTSGSAIRAQMFNDDGTTLGGEFLVNTTTVAFQIDPSIASLADGRFVVTWAGFSQAGSDPSNSAVRAQVFNADGSKSGNEFIVNTTTNVSQLDPAITGLADGSFVISWNDESETGGDTSNTAVRAQVFTADGSKSGGEFLVNTTTANRQNDSSIVGLADGRFVVSWQDSSATGGDTSSSAIRAQVFNGDGSKSGIEFLVNTTTINGQDDPKIVALADGRFVISWEDGSDLGDYSVRAQIFDPRDTSVQLSGTILSDDYVGTRFGDRLYGFEGDDKLKGRFGDDFLFGERGNDILKGGAGNDRISGGHGSDHLFGGFGRDQLLGGNDNDYLTGGANGDFLDGGAGTDRAEYSNATAKVHANLQNSDTNTGEAAGDTYVSIEDLRGSKYNDVLAGNSGTNRIDGGRGNDRIDGGNGADRLIGGSGRDKLDGGKGNDKMTGGKGADTFIFSPGADIVTDFNTTHNKEKIDLSGVSAITGFKDLKNNHLTEMGSDLVIDDANGNTMTLNGLMIADLDKGDFIF